ncbi:uncharacterized protein LOC125045515 isoform X2 [Penaeus chinensis]|uniref:uncharacterized protein LOC125045515 isoform X2 n=1 Tax=Penaeus chinensis TaxID=139456 RepID=UPI001FB80CA8|nr:uncharacterized protein LOC125045515 isoform X2 [Penaeus chinensis]
MPLFHTLNYGFFLVFLVLCGIRDCRALRLNGAWIPYGEGPLSVWWWPVTPSEKLLVSGPEINGEVVAGTPHRWHELLMDRKRLKYCLTASSFLPGRLCSTEKDFLYVYGGRPTFFSFDCTQYPCAIPCSNNSTDDCNETSLSTECSIQRLYGVYVPLDKAATSVFWWPGSADTLGVEGPTIDLYHPVESVQNQWHHIIIMGHEGASAVLPCGINSESLNLSLPCAEDPGDDYDEFTTSRMFVGSYRRRAMTSSYWALGCDVTPAWCPDSTKCTIPTRKEKKEVQWWMKLVVAVEVVLLALGLLWLGNGILFQVRRKRSQKTASSRQQHPHGGNEKQETKCL